MPMLFHFIISTMQVPIIRKTVVNEKVYLFIDNCSAENLDGVKVEFCENSAFSGQTSEEFVPADGGYKCLVYALPEGYENHCVRVSEIVQGVPATTTEVATLETLPVADLGSIVQQTNLNNFDTNPPMVQPTLNMQQIMAAQMMDTPMNYQNPGNIQLPLNTMNMQGNLYQTPNTQQNQTWNRPAVIPQQNAQQMPAVQQSQGQVAPMGIPQQIPQQIPSAKQAEHPIAMAGYGPQMAAGQQSIKQGQEYQKDLAAYQQSAKPSQESAGQSGQAGQTGQAEQTGQSGQQTKTNKKEDTKNPKNSKDTKDTKDTKDSKDKKDKSDKKEEEDSGIEDILGIVSHLSLCLLGLVLE